MDSPLLHNLKQWLQPLYGRWSRLPMRDQRLLLWGGSAIVVAFVYFNLWQPLYKSNQLMQQRIVQAQTTAAYMQQAEKQLQALKGKPGQPVALKSLEQGAKRYQLNTNQLSLSKTAEGAIQLTVKAANFDRLVRFMGFAQQRHQLQVITAKLRQDKVTGQVTGTVLLN